VPKEHEVLIKVEYVGICGSDVHGFESGPFIPPKDPNQEIGLGHECAGTVVAVGNRVTKFKPGDRVNIEPGVPCGHCRYCNRGRPNICEVTPPSRAAGTLLSGAVRMRWNGKRLHHFLGVSLFAQYSVVHRRSLVRIDPRCRWRMPR
ncbi:MAG: alcohol dehydrogenase catalytic domain-containing protein, partial [Roseomonas mucosa]|nr:alcohol dehydrogenase catalytic domain-containing protein [Roseomonas mucosa]